MKNKSTSQAAREAPGCTKTGYTWAIFFRVVNIEWDRGAVQKVISWDDYSHIGRSVSVTKSGRDWSGIAFGARPVMTIAPAGYSPGSGHSGKN